MAHQVEKEDPRDDISSTAINQVAFLAHEIKNSMTSVATFIQLLPTKWDDELFRSRFYPVVNDAVQRITFLINDLLDVGKKQPTHLMPVNFKELIDDLVATKAPLAEQRQVKFHIRFNLKSPLLRMDQEKIGEAIVNLLQNAIEASSDGGDIEIRVEDDQLLSGRPAVRIDIQDSGPGIEAEIQNAIFDPYMSTKTDGLHPVGTGLGLYIAKHHIEAHGGTLLLESSEATGTLFRIVLPVERRRS